MQVTQTVMDAFVQDRKNIEIKLEIGGKVYYSDTLFAESLEVQESIMDSNSLEFGGCIASSATCTVGDMLSTDLNGLDMSISITPDLGNIDWIPLFNGYIESATQTSDKFSKKIVAYDRLKKFADIRIKEWYEGLTFPMTIYELRTALCIYLNIVQEPTILVNDLISVNAGEISSDLSALDLLKSISLLNGRFGIINRLNKFEYREFNASSATNLYPRPTLFPGFNVFPGSGSGGGGGATKQDVPLYRVFKHEEFKTETISKVLIRASVNDEGVSAGSGSNVYVITNDFLASCIDVNDLQTVADNLLTTIKDISYTPFTSEHIGLPYSECGEELWFTSYDGSVKSFPMLSRKIKGIQSLKDSCKAKGTQRLPEVEFKSNATSSNAGASESSQAVKDKGLKAVAVKDNAPTNWEKNTIYFIYTE